MDRPGKRGKNCAQSLTILKHFVINSIISLVNVNLIIFSDFFTSCFHGNKCSSSTFLMTNFILIVKNQTQKINCIKNYVFVNFTNKSQQINFLMKLAMQMKAVQRNAN